MCLTEKTEFHIFHVPISGYCPSHTVCHLDHRVQTVSHPSPSMRNPHLQINRRTKDGFISKNKNVINLKGRWEMKIELYFAAKHALRMKFGQKWFLMGN